MLRRTRDKPLLADFISAKSDEHQREESEDEVESVVEEMKELEIEIGDTKKRKVKGDSPREAKKKRITAMATKALDRYTNDARYHFLHDMVADLFAYILKADLQFLKSNEVGNISTLQSGVLLLILL
ncbi:hypothetical protein GIB67_041854 [Kingdonia uniflora]|uniref:DUF2828 domain-containing protein n=1 Tax=Kingdonia uniflora TaxID=39325 RepID=A0A7J7L5R2_9MAGN|nr:hypothetical protein GIB67_041854 [Kingdonia uniflora]